MNLFISRIFLFSIVLLSTVNMFSQQEIYSQVRVLIENQSQIQKLVSLGFDIDHYEGDAKNGISFYVTQTELEKLKFHNYSYKILIPDFASYYKKQQQNDSKKITHVKKSKNTAKGFDYGSMGGFYTYDEVIAQLDEMRQDFPNLITEKSNIGLSHEGREIWMVKISDNPEVNENEPAVYFDGLHHAREPLSMATNINYMFWLLENYGTNPQVQFLLENRELYFVPIVNPDGYVYNQQTDPNGGGFWRKNRSLNSNGCYGVDLNRNYGYQFSYDDSCASSNECSDIYHGSGPFSEPETIAIRDFLAIIQPKTGFSLHSTAGKYLMPYGYDTSPPAFEIYSEWASSFLNENDYPYGVTYQMLGYTSCGTTRDYLHSEGIYGWTPEIDGSGFWPAQSEIFDLVGENIKPMLYQSWIAGAYLDIQWIQQIGNALPNSSFQLIVEIKNVGIGATSISSEVLIEPSLAGISVSNSIDYGEVPPQTRKKNTTTPFIITIDEGFSASSFNLFITTLQNGISNETSEITINIGDKEVMFFDDSEGGTSNWTSAGNGIPWGFVNDDSYSGTSSFGDSNGGNGLNNTLNYFTLNEPINLTATTFPVVSFYAKHSIVTGDYVNFEISTNGGNSWQFLKKYTFNELWKQQLFDLSSFKTKSDVRFRFLLYNDGNTPGDGFYFDDFEVADYNQNILSTTNFETFSKINIAPNPFEDSFTVEGLGLKDSTIIIYDINGRRLNTAKILKKDTVTFNNLNTLSLGIYFIRIEDKKGNSIMKHILKI